jgi:glutamate synthase (NADPH/NADH) small chain
MRFLIVSQYFWPEVFRVNDLVLSLRQRGHDVTVLERREKAGGLNEYGIAAYKTPDGYAQAEVDWLLKIGGIRVEHGRSLGTGFTLAELRERFAVGEVLGAASAVAASAPAAAAESAPPAEAPSANEDVPPAE